MVHQESLLVFLKYNLGLISLASKYSFLSNKVLPQAKSTSKVLPTGQMHPYTSNGEMMIDMAYSLLNLFGFWIIDLEVSLPKIRI